MRAVILAGGKGTRLAPYTTVFPKPLVPIGDMPILEVVVRQLRGAGVNQITMAVGHLAELLMAFFGDGSRFRVQIDYSREDQPLGTAGPLAQIGGLEDTFLVMNGDVLTTLDYTALVTYHRERRAAATIAMHQRSVKIDLGVIEVSDDNRVVEYIEKPTHDYRVSMGIYVFEPSVLRYVERGVRLDFPELIWKLLADNHPVFGYPYDGYWLDIGRPDDYAQAVDEFEQMRDQFLPEVP
ncbi:MAG TPA: sugar phosphate nucleotidyltransferase [Anaerolineae bacterium]|nr:sugar phosphate nucleotidyltransferase [Anaerolineae bacterium]